MPSEVFLMTGLAAPFIPAEPCPVLDGPHARSPEEGSYMVADAATRDRSAAIRIALWRCGYCGVLLTGIGHQSGRLTGNRADRANTAEVDAQEFTWLQEQVTLLEGKQ
jgi:hypothetical protein